MNKELSFIIKSFFTFFLLVLWPFVNYSQHRNPILDWESLPVIRSGVKIKAYSSVNPTGRTMRDFRNHTLHSAKGHEMGRIYASRGMIVGLWFTSLGWSDQRFGPGRFGRVNIYLSEAASPAFIKDRDLYFNRPTYTFPRPLWDTDGLAQWAFPCLGFNGLMMMTSSENPHWFQVTSHLYRDEEYSEIIDQEDLYTVNNRLMDYRGRFPGNNRGNRSISERTHIATGTRKELFNWNSAGTVRSFTLSSSSTSNPVIDNIWVVVDYGKVEKNAIEVPLTVFFGGYTGAPVTNALGLPCGFEGDEFYFFFPMPFYEGCTISLDNRSGQPLDIDYRIRWSDTGDYEPASTGKFYIQYNENREVSAGEPDFVHLGKKGSGTIVGTTANLAGSIEGNFRVYIDGARTPAVETTGGEDYFCHAFGIDVGLCTPFHGGLYDKIGYRYHIIDYIPFLQSVELTQDHGHEYMHDRDGIFRSAVYYYWNKDALLTLTDEIDVGKQQDERKHQYSVVSGQSRMTTDEGRYEGNYTEMLTDDGRWFNETISFTASIDPGNRGVRLRRRINQKNYHQKLEVRVDGDPAGIWFEQGSNYQLLEEPDPDNHKDYSPDWQDISSIFRDTEFEIPERFTKGKKEINIELKSVGGLSAVDEKDNGFCNDYYYWIFSYE